MTERPNRLSVALLALPDATASVLYGLYDMFASAGRDWDYVVAGRPGPQLIEPRVVALRREGFRAANGVWIEPEAALDACGRPDLVCLPDLLVPAGRSLDPAYAPALAWLRRSYDAGATIASACSGALVLAEAGLLDGREATTHWAYCADLQRICPTARIRPNQVIVADGEGHRLVTAGGGASWQDLGLYLIARFFGAEEAMRIAKLYLIDWHKDGQLPFATLSRSRQSEDRAIAACQEWIAEHYAEPSPVTAMATLSGLSERSFKRRFQKATGMSPIRYVHALRLEEAKQMLETSDDSIEGVAFELGYEDASFFRRLFWREVGLTPAQYRRKFRAMRHSLSAPNLAATNRSGGYSGARSH